MTDDHIRYHSIIHDLKNPLGILLANLSLLADETFGPLNPKQRNLIERSFRSAKSVQTLVRNVLEMGRSEKGLLKFSEFAVSSLILEVIYEVVDIDHTALQNLDGVDLLRAFQKQVRAKEIEVVVDDDFWVAKITSDFGKLKQILANLLSNAMKFRRTKAALLISGDDAYITFSIKDDGKGIPPIYHDKIFESYFQMKSSFEASVRGHGIGLAAVAVLVKDLQGTLDLKSSPDQGANFIVRTPMTRSQ